MKIKEQDSLKDCGIYIIQSLYKFYWKKWLDINELKYLTNYSENGISITELKKIANKVSINIDPFKMTFEELINLNIKDPIITLIKVDNFFHYIIIKKIHKNYFETYDSINGKRKISFENFKLIFSSIILFTKNQKNKNIENKYMYKFQFPFKIKANFLILIILLALISVLLNYFLSFLNKDIFNAIQNKNNEQSFKNLLFLFWISLTVIAVAFVNNIFLNKIKRIISKTIKNNFIKNIQQAKFTQIEKITKNDITIRFLSINLISEFYALFVFFWPTFLLSITLVFPLIFFINFKFIIILTLTNVIKVFIGILFNLNIYKLSKKSIENNLKEINDLSFISHNWNFYDIDFWNSIQKNNFFYTSQINLNLQRKINAFSSFKTVFLSFLNLLNNIIIYTLFIKLQLSNITQLFFILQVQNLLNDPINNLQNYSITKLINKTNIQKIFFVLKIPLKNNKNKFKNNLILNSIRIKNLSLNLGSKKIFSDLNLHIEKNLIIKGENGIGKTTFLKLISGLFYDTKNSIFFNNIPIEKISPSWFTKNVYFSNKNNDFPNTDLYTYLFWNINEKQRNEILRNNDFIFLLNALKLDIFSNLYINKSNLSAGQIQIIKLLPLVIKKYQLILLDETFEFLSNDVWKIMQKCILEKQQNSIIIETSHNEKFLIKNSPVFVIKKIS
ncbi:Mbov_0121 family peptidase domain-containing ABC transporter [Metamycoplasma canadense]|uniref:ABC transporter ATP-binding protein n=1 Tax=Metamycoplasma canadense TaxID=29554 RepID=A0A077L5Z6_9BACT|nr:cysteine peptidase family C39 domain-containing protein [Metamycoplasma canadense]BAP39417.1 ABC transporter ATP-binding protein [Metamycoplasma canadense]